jgi:hypothetical protein
MEVSFLVMHECVNSLPNPASTLDKIFYCTYLKLSSTERTHLPIFPEIILKKIKRIH